MKAISMAVAVFLAFAISSVTYAQYTNGSANDANRAVQIMPAVGFAPDDYSPPKAESWPNWNCTEPAHTEKHCGIIRPLQNRLATCFAQAQASGCTGCDESHCNCSGTPCCHERHCGIIQPLHNMMSRSCGACEVHAKPVCCARHCGVILPLKDMLTERCDGSGCGCRCGYGCLSCAPLYAYFLDECGGGNAGSQEGCHGTEMQQGCCSSH